MCVQEGGRTEGRAGFMSQSQIKLSSSPAILSLQRTAKAFILHEKQDHGGNESFNKQCTTCSKCTSGYDGNMSPNFCFDNFSVTKVIKCLHNIILYMIEIYADLKEARKRERMTYDIICYQPSSTKKGNTTVD